MLSGTISGLEDFKDKRLVDKRVKLANIASFYHNETMLAEVYQSVMDQYKSRSLDFPSCAELQASIISPADGTIINAYSENSLLGLVLSWIFLQPVDWAAVDATLSSLGQSSTTGRNATQVNNYGPGYGAGRASEWGPGAPIIRDVTFIDALETKPREKPALSGDIAIIGMAAQLPDADDCEEFWVNLENQKNSCREVRLLRMECVHHTATHQTFRYPNRGLTIATFKSDPTRTEKEEHYPRNGATFCRIPLGSTLPSLGFRHVRHCQWIHNSV